MVTITQISWHPRAIEDQLLFHPSPRAVLFLEALLLGRGFICSVGRLRKRNRRRKRKKRRREDSVEEEHGGEEGVEEVRETRGGRGRGR